MPKYFTKYIRHVAILALILSIATFPERTMAATWVVFQNFDTLTLDATLVGVGGGTGWSTNVWEDHSGGSNWKSSTAPAGGQGCLAAFSTTANTYVKRIWETAISNSVVHFEFRLADNTSGNRYAIWFRDSAVGSKFGIEMNTAAGGGGGSINATDGTSYSSDTTLDFSTSAWNKIDIKFGHSAGKFAISLNGGAYSSDFTASGSNTSVNQVMFANIEGGGDFYIDDIADAETAACGGAAAPTSILGLVKAFFW